MRVIGRPTIRQTDTASLENRNRYSKMSCYGGAIGMGVNCASNKNPEEPFSTKHIKLTIKFTEGYSHP